MNLGESDRCLSSIIPQIDVRAIKRLMKRRGISEHEAASALSRKKAIETLMTEQEKRKKFRIDIFHEAKEYIRKEKIRKQLEERKGALIKRQELSNANKKIKKTDSKNPNKPHLPRQGNGAPGSNCVFFNRTGRCLAHGKCLFVHDKNKINICRKFLKGNCKEKSCLLRHEFDEVVYLLVS